ncbi:unnamed protein product [Ilex paraguariensis]|uniref:RNA helicase n=1 Tax=Ilex paraguariensis TaxID=185542 RepID=A0ABC8TRK6_9AQUA
MEKRMGPTNGVGFEEGARRYLSIGSFPEELTASSKTLVLRKRLQHRVDILRRCVHALDAKSLIAFMNCTKQLKDAVFKLDARGIKAAELHGDLGKLARPTISKKFKNGQVRVLVTNELSAKSLDGSEM